MGMKRGRAGRTRGEAPRVKLGQEATLEDEPEAQSLRRRARLQRVAMLAAYAIAGWGLLALIVVGLWQAF